MIHNENFKNVSSSRKLENLCLFVWQSVRVWHCKFVIYNIDLVY
jgi:hypothetical protein